MPLSWSDVRDRAVTFVKEHSADGSENAQSQLFWRDFLHVFDVPVGRVGSYEHHVRVVRRDQVRDKHGRIDLFWPGKLLVEMKSAGAPLERAFLQAQAYFDNLPKRDLPVHILVCNFQEFWLFNMETGGNWRFRLKDFPDRIKHFAFILGYEVPRERPEIEANIKAAQQMGRLFKALEAAGYAVSRDGHDLRVLMVRLLFCLFADDTGIFQPSGTFREWVDSVESASQLGRLLNELFETLNTPEHQRPQARRDDYAPFRYINGKLFEETLRTPAFDEKARELLLDACAINWGQISPAIFGSLFQSIKEKEDRRDLGEHYTSEENILKLIKPLFLDGLWAEFEKIRRQKNRLFEFQKKLRSLTFLDPACGCGNFLVIAYRELRRLELEVLRASQAIGQQYLEVGALSQVNVDQFFGIEIEEFPAQIAQVAMWLTDHQMNRLLTEEFGKYFDRLPLKSTPHIHHGNALRVDWAGVLPAASCSFVVGNPPFVGAKFMADAQRDDIRHVFTGIDNAGLLDFVAAWYVKAARYMRSWNEADAMALPKNEKAPIRPQPRTAFVATNSITQGEQVGVLWTWLLAQGMHIHFAHRTFKWHNEARGKAAVHCVIIGFGLEDVDNKTIFEYDDIAGEPHAVAVRNINPYLVDGPDVVLPRRSQPICDVPGIGIGNKPIDGGNYLFSIDERDAFIQTEPQAAKWFRRWLGADEFLNGYERWCLWLGDCEPAELRAMPEVLKRVRAVKRFREASKSLPTQKLASTPTRFHVENMPQSRYLVIPEVSSERRSYIPFGFEEPATLCSNLVKIAPDATLFHFGILSSTMHNAWVRLTCGRLKSDYRYSKDIVYNNFPWAEALLNSAVNNSTEKQPSIETKRTREAIETAASEVLQTRAKHPESSLADLYDPLTMPPDLRKAHQKLDAAVDKAYELSGGKKTYKTDAERVAFLFELYQRLTSLLPSDGIVSKLKRKTGIRAG